MSFQLVHANLPLYTLLVKCQPSALLLYLYVYVHMHNYIGTAGVLQDEHLYCMLTCGRQHYVLPHIQLLVEQPCHCLARCEGSGVSC